MAQATVLCYNIGHDLTKQERITNEEADTHSDDADCDFSAQRLYGCGPGAQQDCNDFEASRIESAGEKDKSGLDWSFVPVLRERATAMFTEAFPDYPVTDASVACKDARRVIVTLTYMRDGIAGKYGFDYKLGENGEYELDRYGDGVSAGDL